MKRTILFLICICMLSTYACVQAAPITLSEETVNAAIDDLREMNIVTGYSDGEYRPDEKITRGEAAKLVKCMISDEFYTAGIFAEDFRYPYDEHWSYKYIETLVGMQIINFHMNDFYRPDDNITGFEFIEMIINSLGYKNDAENKGGYPLGYCIQAELLGIIKTSVYRKSADITRGQAAVVISKSLDVPRKFVYEYSMLDGCKYKVYENNTFRRVLKGELLFTEDDKTDIDGEENLKFNIKINNAFYTALCKEDEKYYNIELKDKDKICIVADDDTTKTDYQNYYLRIRAGRMNDTEEDFFIHATTEQIGPFASPSIVISDIKEYVSKLTEEEVSDDIYCRLGIISLPNAVDEFKGSVYLK